MTQIEKIDLIVAVFKDMKIMFPDNSITLYIHYIKIEDLPKNKWVTKKSMLDSGKEYQTARLKREDGSNIILFD